MTEGGEATTLNNIGELYSRIGQPQQALNYYNQVLPIVREVNDRRGEATTLSNIGLVYRIINQPTQAIARWQESVEITLEMRGGLLQENRQQFLEANQGTSIALADLLIDQKQPEKAFEWINRVTTFELAEFSRLIDARVSNPEAQKLIDEWNQKIQQLNSLRQQAADNNYPVALQQTIIDLEAETRRQAEEISRRFPEVAELFETTPTDINILRANIPAGTVVIQPVLLTNISNVPNTVALFVLTQDELKVIKHPIEPKAFDQLVTDHYQALTGRGDDTATGIQLYDILIRPIESQIQALAPKKLSIIATGKLRYIPFETFYDSQKEEYLIEKYPINYLTRISARSLQETPNSTPSQGGILGLGNPVPRYPQNLLGSEEEVKSITALFPGSASYLNSEATLDRFKLQASRFPILHLATHGCFQPEGCPNINLKANTILFADTQFNIADAALLGLNGTRLLTLSACQTALNTNSDGQEISGIAYIFERAGARTVMATLWSVDDPATRDLMVQFYQNLNTGNMSTSEALRQAKISQIQAINDDGDENEKGFHPYYWSGFVLIGDGR
ncbi:MAG: CHAT domain-containing protein [Desertifilum sp.]|nr:CHAT domain-containing protein [Desertifilum sp.]